MQNRAEDFQSLRSSLDCGRVFPFGVRVGKTAYGFGVFAYAFIPKGTPIARIAGKIIIDPDYGSDYCISAGEGKVLEPSAPFCYLNHACEPNCLLTQYVSECDIVEGEELEEGNLETSDLERDSDKIEESDDENEELDDDDDECFFGEGSAPEKAELDDESDARFNSKIKSVSISVSKNISKVVKSEEVGNDVIEYDPEFDDDVDSELWVETLRDIFPGEQLTIDYAWPADKLVKCLCGCKKCRGWIVAEDELELLLKNFTE
ncbi:MAG: hypothetical protein LBB88_02470 [Planctomycetaceae bacterium]|jgi:hypothetical protein|nr:hypothetical protein [Planctomycetaceae bacterium]